MKWDDDKELIEKVMAGEHEAFAEFISRYKNLVLHLVNRMIPNAADREDIGQEIFIKIYRNLGDFRFASKVSTWVAKISHNTCLNYLEKKKVPLLEDIKTDDHDPAPFVERFESNGPSPLAKVEQDDRVTILHQEIEELPVHYKTALTLFHIEEMSYAEIAEIMNLPEGTVKSYLFRARQLLRHRLLQACAEEAVWQ